MVKRATNRTNRGIFTSIRNNKSNMKTAVDWLTEQLINSGLDYPINEASKIFEQAKEMEKGHHGNTWDAAIQAHEDRGYVIARSITDFDEYYEETYGNEDDLSDWDVTLNDGLLD
jgi:hypothetical protein